MRNSSILIAVSLACLGLALQQTWPGWDAPDEWLVGNWVHPDCLSNHWLLVWVTEQLLEGRGHRQVIALNRAGEEHLGVSD
ncbi:MAG: hypothetical protein QGG40_13690, partial [Myxococcota bacterium]|nr:hypothetical protein [Myxococcota bacterium]